MRPSDGTVVWYRWRHRRETGAGEGRGRARRFSRPCTVGPAEPPVPRRFSCILVCADMYVPKTSVWARLDEDSRKHLVDGAVREVARRSYAGAMVYFATLAAVPFASSCLRDHPTLTIAALCCTFAGGAMRCIAAADAAPEDGCGFEYMERRDGRLNNCDRYVLGRVLRLHAVHVSEYMAFHLPDDRGRRAGRRVDHLDGAAASAGHRGASVDGTAHRFVRGAARRQRLDDSGDLGVRLSDVPAGAVTA